VATSTIVFEGDGQLREYVGGYDDWLRQRTVQAAPFSKAPEEKKRRREKDPQEKQRLSYKENQELEGLPLKIEELEKRKRLLHETLNSPEFYAGRDSEKIVRANDELKAIEKILEAGYERWDELENLSAKLGGETTI
jgi:ATP-binding cassette subfamily F protein uup